MLLAVNLELGAMLFEVSIQPVIPFFGVLPGNREIVLTVSFGVNSYPGQNVLLTLGANAVHEYLVTVALIV
jgi:hypothetical protein